MKNTVVVDGNKIIQKNNTFTKTKSCTSNLRPPKYKSYKSEK